MIVKMNKVQIAARTEDRQKLLEALEDLGVVHVTPVAPAQAVADEPIAAAIRETERALQILGSIKPKGARPAVAPADAVAEVHALQRSQAELQARLTGLHRQMDQIKAWGDVRTEQLDALREADLSLQLLSVPTEAVAALGAECVQVVGQASSKRTLVVMVERRRKLKLPDGVEAIAPPTRDAPSIRAEAGEVDAELKRNEARLTALAYLQPELRGHLAELQSRAEFSRVLKSGLAGEDLFALQGWVPAEQAPTLGGRINRAGIQAAVQYLEPTDADSPPTLVSCPGWVKPIKGLFGVLGTVPGYREFDVSKPFMIALPIFAAFLFADSGYGLVLLLLPMLFYKKASAALGAEFTRLLIVIGGVSTVFGMLCGSFFGKTLWTPIYPVDLSDQARNMGMAVSFAIGAVHLSFAQLWQAMALHPHRKFLSKVGWAVFIWGMLGVVRMFVLKSPFGWNTPWPYLLIAGAALAVLFDSPDEGWIKRILFGIANFPLAMLGAFGDVISYVRLMAVGLAGSVLAVSFNDMAFQTGFLPLTILILVAGHGLNIGLCMIALFAHGVRLNMLEFSNNLGMQWTGYAYAPFGRRVNQENVV